MTLGCWGLRLLHVLDSNAGLVELLYREWLWLLVQDQQRLMLLLLLLLLLRV